MASSTPFVARAGVLSFVASFFGSQARAEESSVINSQNIGLLKADIRPGTSPSGGADIAIVDKTALVSDDAPLSSEDRDTPHRPGSDQISVYVVREEDTLSQIADMFDVSINTILWTNNLTSKTVHKGQVLIILPITGVKYTVKKGDTIASIAKTYKGDVDEIRNYNNLAGKELAAGMQIIIPDGEIVTVAPKKNTKSSSGSASAVNNLAGYFMRPLSGGVKTQGIHGYNGIDIGTPVGSTVYAAASGKVIISRGSGWNGGYGGYIVISHPNGTQTLYAHLSSAIVGTGQTVVQGQVIGYSGNTGKSTGAHLHFEVRGARNPF